MQNFNQNIFLKLLLCFLFYTYACLINFTNGKWIMASTVPMYLQSKFKNLNMVYLRSEFNDIYLQCPNTLRWQKHVLPRLSLPNWKPVFFHHPSDRILIHALDFIYRAGIALEPRLKKCPTLVKMRYYVIQMSKKKSAFYNRYQLTEIELIISPVPGADWRVSPWHFFIRHFVVHSSPVHRTNPMWGDSSVTC